MNYILCTSRNMAVMCPSHPPYILFMIRMLSYYGWGSPRNGRASYVLFMIRNIIRLTYAMVSEGSVEVKTRRMAASTDGGITFLPRNVPKDSCAWYRS